MDRRRRRLLDVNCIEISKCYCYKGIFFKVFRIKYTAGRATSSSVNGRVIQIPLIPNKNDNKNAIGITSRNPRKTETKKASPGLSVELKKVAVIMLIPMKTNAVK